MSNIILVHDICCSSKLDPHLRILNSSVKVHHSFSYDVNVCGGEKLKFRFETKRQKK